MMIIANVSKVIVNMAHSYFINCCNIVRKKLGNCLNGHKLFFLSNIVTQLLKIGHELVIHWNEINLFIPYIRNKFQMD